jgi:hypothetical protein
VEEKRRKRGGFTAENAEDAEKTQRRGREPQMNTDRRAKGGRKEARTDTDTHGQSRTRTGGFCPFVAILPLAPLVPFRGHLLFFLSPTCAPCASSWPSSFLLVPPCAFCASLRLSFSYPFHLCSSVVPSSGGPASRGWPAALRWGTDAACLPAAHRMWFGGRTLGSGSGACSPLARGLLPSALRRKLRAAPPCECLPLRAPDHARSVAERPGFQEPARPLR